MAARSKSRDQRQTARPLTPIEHQRLVDALRFARCTPSHMRPLLNKEEATTLEMYRRVRTLEHGATPKVSRLAEYLGGTRESTIEQLEALRRKGFLHRAADCSLYIETCESVVHKCSDALLALAVSLASINPATEKNWRQAAANHHANAVDICRKLAQLVQTSVADASKHAADSSISGPHIPLLLRSESEVLAYMAHLEGVLSDLRAAA